MNLHERSLSVLACRYVGEVIIGAPWEVSKDTITTFNISLVVHGTVAIGLALAGQLKEIRVINILTVYYGIENSVRSLAPHVVQWLLGSYNTQLLLMVFLAIVSLLLQVSLVTMGTSVLQIPQHRSFGVFDARKI